MSDISNWLEETRQINYTKKLKLALEKRGMNNYQFAKLCGCRKRTIDKITSNHFFVPVPKYVWETAKKEFSI